MQKQKELLGTLSAKNAPSFDLAAAKRRKKATLSRAVGWASAAAAVFVVVLLAGSMTGLFSGAKAEAPMAIRSMDEEAAPAPAAEEAEFEVYAAEGAAPAEEAPATEEAPAEEAAVEEAPAAEEAPAEEAAFDENHYSDRVNDFTLPQNDLTALIDELCDAGYPPEQAGTNCVLMITDENIGIAKEIFARYTDIELIPDNAVYFAAE